MPLIVEIRRGSLRGGGRRNDQGIRRRGWRRRHVLQSGERARREINAPELLDQLEDVTGGLAAKLAQHPGRKRIEGLARVRLGAATLEQLAEPAPQERLGLTPRQGPQSHRQRAEALDPVADRAVDPFANGVVESGQNRKSHAQRRKRLGQQRAPAEQVPQPGSHPWTRLCSS